jgi:hypothetical protein
VAELVVDGFEPVEVEHRHCDRRAAVQRRVEVIEKRPPVG